MEYYSGFHRISVTSEVWTGGALCQTKMGWRCCLQILHAKACMSRGWGLGLGSGIQSVQGGGGNKTEKTWRKKSCCTACSFTEVAWSSNVAAGVPASRAGR